ncbi:MAG: DEAD/DEAH box helicase family protein [Candidatus Kapabacteria bacterium]|nr:DEAD/DEAH box helicase family protein [Candidatus Kapabacteria bacterium]
MNIPTRKEIIGKFAILSVDLSKRFYQKSIDEVVINNSTRGIAKTICELSGLPYEDFLKNLHYKDTDAAPQIKATAPPAETYWVPVENKKNRKYDEEMYFKHTQMYYKNSYADSNIATLEPQITKLENELEAIKGQRGEEFAKKRQILEDGLKDYKAKRREYVRIKEKAELTDIGTGHYTAIQNIIEQSFKDNGGVLPENIRLQRIKYLETFSLASGAWEFYPTPASIVDKMIDAADIDPLRHPMILEPSGGKGNILDKLYAKYGNDVTLQTIELNPSNREILTLKGYRLMGRDFLEMPPEPLYDRILMNPPFEDGSDIKHVLHAFKFLKPDGKLVSVMSRAALITNAPKNIAFASFVKQTGAVEPLPDDSFHNAERAATVKTVLVSLLKEREVNTKSEVEINFVADLKLNDYFADDYNSSVVFKVISLEPKIVLKDIVNEKTVPYTVNKDLPNLPLRFKKLTEEEAHGIQSKLRLGKSAQGQRPDIHGGYSAGERQDNGGGYCNAARPDPESLEFAGLVDARPGLSQRPAANHLAESIAKTLKPHQRDGANLAIESIHKSNSFLLADGTGAGKTMQALAVAYHFVKERNKPALIVTISDTVAEQAFMGDADKLGIKPMLKLFPGFKSGEDVTSMLDNNKIYLCKYTDFIAFGGLNHPLRLAHSKAVAERDAWLKILNGQLAGLKKEFERGEMTKKEYENARKAVNGNKVNEQKFYAPILALEAWDAEQARVFGTIGKKFSTIVFDECHKIKNWTDYDLTGDIAARRAVMLLQGCGSALFMSATPADRADAIMYLKYAGLYENADQFRRFLAMAGFKHSPEEINNVGIVIRREKWALPKKADNSLALAAIDRRFEDMTEDGLMIKRELNLRNMSVEIVKVDIPQAATELADRIRQSFLEDQENDSSKASLANMQMETLRALEPYKLNYTRELAEKELSEGRNVVIFAMLKDEGQEMKNWDDVKAGTIFELYKHFSSQCGKDNVALLVGGQKAADRELGINQFQKNIVRIAIGTPQVMATGLSLDDQTGKAPRTLICMSAPLNAESNVQMLGRVYRAETKSFSKSYYLFAKDVAIETWISGVVANKMKMLNAIVSGETKSFIFDNMSQTQIDLSETSGSDFLNKLDQERQDSVSKSDSDKGDKKRYRHELFNLNYIDGMQLATKLPYIAQIKDETGEYRNSQYIAIRIKANSLKELKSLHARFQSEFDKYGFTIESGRWEGSYLEAKFKRRDTDDFLDCWNFILNIFIPEKTASIANENQQFQKGDRVKFVQTTAEALEGDEGTIDNVRKRLVSRDSIKNKETDEMVTKEAYAYFYDIKLDNGSNLRRVEQYKIISTGKIKLSVYEIIKSNFDEIIEMFKLENDYNMKQNPVLQHDSYPDRFEGEEYFDYINFYEISRGYGFDLTFKYYFQKNSDKTEVQFGRYGQTETAEIQLKKFQNWLNDKLSKGLAGVFFNKYVLKGVPELKDIARAVRNCSDKIAHLEVNEPNNFNPKLKNRLKFAANVCGYDYWDDYNDALSLRRRFQSNDNKKKFWEKHNSSIGERRMTKTELSKLNFKNKADLEIFDRELAKLMMITNYDVFMSLGKLYAPFLSRMTAQENKQLTSLDMVAFHREGLFFKKYPTAESYATGFQEDTAYPVSHNDKIRAWELWKSKFDMQNHISSAAGLGDLFEDYELSGTGDDLHNNLMKYFGAK